MDNIRRFRWFLRMSRRAVFVAWTTAFDETNTPQEEKGND